uniref:Uncharacterized protein n=1 Tax=Bionectria ochroleuca TaxID=29856 RepID=A0A0B7JS87_BIOOC
MGLSLPVQPLDSLVSKIENLAIILKEAVPLCITLPSSTSLPRRDYDLLLISILHNTLHRRWRESLVVQPFESIVACYWQDAQVKLHDWNILPKGPCRRNACLLGLIVGGCRLLLPLFLFRGRILCNLDVFKVGH